MSRVDVVLENLQLSDGAITYLVAELRKINDAKNEFYEQTFANLRAEHDRIENRINNMLDARFDGSITAEDYDRKLKEYKEKQHELRNEMQKYDIADENYYITVNSVLSVAQRAQEIFVSSEPNEKRQLLNFLVQNLKLHEKELHLELKKPFNFIVDLHKLETQSGKKKHHRIGDVSSLARAAGFEPATWGLTVPRSTTELRPNV